MPDNHRPAQHPYLGRFAPSPTGPLHFGSLVSALASYLDAHYNRGKWLVRIEDLDPPREQAGATQAILRCLEDHGLHWDDAVVYQSQRSHLYDAYLERLRAQDLLYRCDCTRQDLQSINGIYTGHCRNRNVDANLPHSLRLKLYDLPPQIQHVIPNGNELSFTDLIQGKQRQNLRTDAGDQILKRKDNLYAYQLGVVVDDIEQGITHIIRGSDLLDVTARQIFLFNVLGAPVPSFGHVTLATQPNGQKLSKQNLAPELKSSEAGINLWQALAFLGQNPPATLCGASPKELLDWGKQHWQRAAIRGLAATIKTKNNQRDTSNH